MVSDSRGYSYHSDGLGSVVNLTDSAGLNANTYNYKAFGSIRSQSGTVANVWRYTGRQYDAESGLHFYRNRYYDVRVGRFITQDPSLKFNSNSNVSHKLLNNLPLPLKLNPFAYTTNNPVNLADPFGLEAIPVPWYEDPITLGIFIATVGPKIAALLKDNVSIDGPSASGRIIQVRFGGNIVIIRLDYHPLVSGGGSVLYINVEIGGHNIHIPLSLTKR